MLSSARSSGIVWHHIGVELGLSGVVMMVLPTMQRKLLIAVIWSLLWMMIANVVALEDTVSNKNAVLHTLVSFGRQERN
jgi:hypothetical protein